MKLATVSLALALAGCPSGASSPTLDVDAVAPTVTGVCSLIEGIDDNGAIRNICATVEEVAEVIAFVLTLRSGDAGAPVGCAPLPGSTFCATSHERAKAITFLVRARTARLTLDGGAP